MAAKGSRAVVGMEESGAAMVVRVIIGFLSLFIPLTLAKRIVGMLLFAVDASAPKVRDLTGCCERTVRSLRGKIMKVKNESDVQQMLTIGHGGGRKSTIAGLEEQIIAELEANNFRTCRQIGDMLKAKFSLSLSESGIRRFLKKHGYKHLQTGSLPAKADPVKQRTFYETTLAPLLKQARDSTSKVAVLFVDASHFVLGCDFLGRVWSRVRRLCCTFSGRRRWNVLGALDYATKQMVTIENDTYITATEVCALFRSIAEAFRGKEIHLVLDNARYQKCAVVKELADNLKIHLEYIPPYSPNLNLIERIWKLVKSSLRCQYFEDFDRFKAEIDSVLSMLATDLKDRVEHLTQNVQLFDHLVPQCENTFAFPCSPGKAA